MLSLADGSGSMGVEVDGVTQGWLTRVLELDRSTILLMIYRMGLLRKSNEPRHDSSKGKEVVRLDLTPNLRH